MATDDRLTRRLAALIARLGSVAPAAAPASGRIGAVGETRDEPEHSAAADQTRDSQSGDREGRLGRTER
jgi:hypothetical protein